MAALDYEIFKICQVGMGRWLARQAVYLSFFQMSCPIMKVKNENFIILLVFCAVAVLKCTVPSSAFSNI